MTNNGTSKNTSHLHQLCDTLFRTSQIGHQSFRFHYNYQLRLLPVCFDSFLRFTLLRYVHDDVRSVKIGCAKHDGFFCNWNYTWIRSDDFFSFVGMILLFYIRFIVFCAFLYCLPATFITDGCNERGTGQNC